MRDRKQRLEATKITSDVNAKRVEQLRGLRVKVPGTGTGKDLEGAKEVSERLWAWLRTVMHGISDPFHVNVPTLFRCL